MMDMHLCLMFLDFGDYMKIPKNEEIVTEYAANGIIDYVATQHQLTDKFTLYKIIGSDYERIKVTETPISFDDIIKKNRSN